MPNLLGAILPGILVLLLLVAGRASSSLSFSRSLAVLTLSFGITVLLSRWHVDEDRIALFLVPGATPVLLYLLWRGHRISPGYAFVITYLSDFPADVLLATRFIGSFEHALPGIGGAGLLDGLVMIPTLTALGVWYGNWRMAGGQPLAGFRGKPSISQGTISP